MDGEGAHKTPLLPQELMRPHSSLRNCCHAMIAVNKEYFSSVEPTLKSNPPNPFWNQISGSQRNNKQTRHESVGQACREWAQQECAGMREEMVTVAKMTQVTVYE